MEKDYDVFLSYQGSSIDIAETVYESIVSWGISCFFAKEACTGEFAGQLTRAIRNCRVFLLIQNKAASSSMHVLNEVNLAFNRLEEDKPNDHFSIMQIKTDNEELGDSMAYYLGRDSWINAYDYPLEHALLELEMRLKGIFNIEFKGNKKGKSEQYSREKNLYFDNNALEKNRLAQEGELLYPIEKKIYDKLFLQKNNLNVLDLSVLNVDGQYRLFDRDEIAHYVGLSYSPHIVEEGNAIDDERFSFHLCNFNIEDIGAFLNNLLKNINVRKFDLINLNMVILDMSSPMTTLSKLVPFLAEDGMIYVRDIDDAFSFAYPDKNGLVEKYLDYADADRLAGYRKSGRQVYSYLKKLGASEITLELCGLSTSNIKKKDRSRLFTSYFTFLPNEYDRLRKENPDNKAYAEADAWLDENMPLIEEEFFDPSFLFVGGFVIYTAKFKEE